MSNRERDGVLADAGGKYFTNKGEDDDGEAAC